MTRSFERICSKVEGISQCYNRSNHHYHLSIYPRTNTVEPSFIKPQVLFISEAKIWGEQKNDWQRLAMSASVWLTVWGNVDLFWQFADVDFKSILHIVEGLGIFLIRDKRDSQTLGAETASSSDLQYKIHTSKNEWKVTW